MRITSHSGKNDGGLPARNSTLTPDRLTLIAHRDPHGDDCAGVVIGLELAYLFSFQEEDQ